MDEVSGAGRTDILGESNMRRRVFLLAAAATPFLGALSFASEPRVILIASHSPVKTFAEFMAQTTPLNFAASGLGSASYLEIVTVGADSTAILQRRFQADRQLRRQLDFVPHDMVAGNVLLRGSESVLRVLVSDSTGNQLRAFAIETAFARASSSGSRSALFHTSSTRSGSPSASTPSSVSTALTSAR